MNYDPQNPPATITMPVSAWSVVLNGLAELPAKSSMAVINEVLRVVQPIMARLQGPPGGAANDGPPHQETSEVAEAAAEAVGAPAKKTVRRKR